MYSMWQNVSNCRLYLISPPAIESSFADALKSALDGGDVGAFQLRLKNISDSDILKAAEMLLPICQSHGVAFIMNDSPTLAKQSGADGVHLGQDDFLASPSPPEGEGRDGGAIEGTNATATTPHPSPPPQGGREINTLADIRKLLGPETIIGVSCHDSRHLAMEAGEQGADYVAFGAFYPTQSKSAEALARWGTPTPDILEWWQTYMLLPCVAIGGITPGNVSPLVKAGADFVAAITAVWNHPESPKKAVQEFNEAIRNVNV